MNIENVMEHGAEAHKDLTVTLPVCCYREIIRLIAMDIQNAPVPEEMTWQERIGFLIAKSNLSNMVRENINAII